MTTPFGLGGAMRLAGIALLRQDTILSCRRPVDSREALPGTFCMR